MYLLGKKRSGDLLLFSLKCSSVSLSTRHKNHIRNHSLIVTPSLQIRKKKRKHVERKKNKERRSFLVVPISSFHLSFAIVPQICQNIYCKGNENTFQLYLYHLFPVVALAWNTCHEIQLQAQIQMSTPIIQKKTFQFYPCHLFLSPLLSRLGGQETHSVRKKRCYSLSLLDFVFVCISVRKNTCFVKDSGHFILKVLLLFKLVWCFVEDL